MASLIYTGDNSDVLTISHATSINSLPAFTSIMWFWVNATPGADERIWGKGQFAGGGFRAHTIDTTGRITYAVNRATAISETKFDSWTTGKTNKWWFHAVVYTEATGSILYEGSLTSQPTQLTATTTTVGSGATNADTGGAGLLIGNFNGETRSLAGKIAEFQYWNRALSLSEIVDQWRYDDRAARFGRVVNIKLGDKGSAATQRDLSGYNNHGTLTGTSFSGAGPNRPPRPRPLDVTGAAAAPTTGTVTSMLSLMGVG